MINDLARITTISVLTLKKLFNNLSMCICHRVLENYLDKKIDTVVDIGIGKLAISMESDCIFYKFIPSQKFESMLVETINTKTSPLVAYAEDILISKVKNAYKELM